MHLIYFMHMHMSMYVYVHTTPWLVYSRSLKAFLVHQGLRDSATNGDETVLPTAGDQRPRPAGTQSISFDRFKDALE